ncbi:dimethylaniline monooxygenase [Usnea florida]
MKSNYDVVIVGAGPQGLGAARIFLQLEPKLNLLIADTNMSLGGVWAKENLYQGLVTNNLRGTFEYTDFPMDDALGVKTGEHIPGEVIHEYLCRYAEKHDLTRRIELGQKVTVAEKLQEGWKLELETAGPKGQTVVPQPAQQTVTCSKLIVAAGLTSVPFPIIIKGSENFNAPIVNFGDYARRAPQFYEDSAIRHVTVLGGGKAAHDIAYLMGAHGKRVTWIIRASGYGPTYMARPHIHIGPFRCWLEKLTTTRCLTWLSPCVWGDADGFGLVRNLLHGTRWGRWFVDTFWAKMESDTLQQSGILKNEATKDLAPDQSMFWYGVSIAILNYPKDIYELVRSGQVEVIRKDIESLESENTIRFEDGTCIQTDAFIASMGWIWTPSIQYLPKELHADLGLPSTEYSRTQQEIWNKLDSRADAEIFARFPKLATGPRMDQGPTIGQEKSGSREGFTPWRLWRGIAPPSLPSRDIVFLGNVQLFQGTLRAEISSLWAYAYMMGELGPARSICKPSKQLRLEQPAEYKDDMAIKQAGTVDDVRYDTALLQRWCKWRTPYGFGARHPDIVFEGIAYFDMLLQDLGLRSWRKGWGWVGEVFGGSYGQADYKGLVEEWKENRRGRK